MFSALFGYSNNENDEYTSSSGESDDAADETPQQTTTTPNTNTLTTTYNNGTSPPRSRTASISNTTHTKRIIDSDNEDDGDGDGDGDSFSDNKDDSIITPRANRAISTPQHINNKSTTPSGSNFNNNNVTFSPLSSNNNSIRGSSKYQHSFLQILPPIPQNYPMHAAVLKKDLDGLKNAIESLPINNDPLALRKDLPINALDHHGYSALHLAVLLSWNEGIKILLSADASCRVRSRGGWSAIQEAISTSQRDILKMLYQRNLIQMRDGIARRAPIIRSKVAEKEDFYLEIDWKFTSWIPFLSRFCPSDTFKIWKHGSDFRIDISLIDFNQFQWKRGHLSFIFKFNQETEIIELYILNHVKKTKTVTNKAEQFQQDEKDVDEHVELLLQSELMVPEFDSKHIDISPAKTWFGYNKVDSVNGLECDFYTVSNVVVFTNKRDSHVPEEVKQERENSNKMFQSNVEKADVDETDPFEIDFYDEATVEAPVAIAAVESVENRDIEATPNTPNQTNNNLTFPNKPGHKSANNSKSEPQSSPHARMASQSQSSQESKSFLTTAFAILTGEDEDDNDNDNENEKDIIVPQDNNNNNLLKTHPGHSNHRASSLTIQSTLAAIPSEDSSDNININNNNANNSSNNSDDPKQTIATLKRASSAQNLQITNNGNDNGNNNENNGNDVQSERQSRKHRRRIASRSISTSRSTSRNGKLDIPSMTSGNGINGSHTQGSASMSMIEDMKNSAIQAQNVISKSRSPSPSSFRNTVTPFGFNLRGGNKKRKKKGFRSKLRKVIGKDDDNNDDETNSSNNTNGTNSAINSSNSAINNVPISNGNDASSGGDNSSNPNDLEKSLLTNNTSVTSIQSAPGTTDIGGDTNSSNNNNNNNTNNDNVMEVKVDDEDEVKFYEYPKWDPPDVNFNEYFDMESFRKRQEKMLKKSKKRKNNNAINQLYGETFKLNNTETTRSMKTFKLSLAMSKEFGLTIDEIVPILEAAAPQSKLAAKLKEFLEIKMPQGFPVQLEMPLYHILKATVTFQNYAHVKISEDIFEIPDNYELVENDDQSDQNIVQG